MSKILEEKTKKNKEALIKAMEKHLGIVTAACKETGLSRDSYYKYLRTDPDFKNKIDELYEYQLDFVESQLLKNIAKGDRASIMFYMKYKGRSRGYAESHIVDANVKMEQPLLSPIEVINKNGTNNSN